MVTHQEPSHAAKSVVWNQSEIPTYLMAAPITDAHLVQNDTGDDEESEHVEQEFACGVGAEDTLIPSARLVQQ